MEISPIQLFRLLLVSVCFGGGLGVLHTLHRLFRVALGICEPSEQAQKLYEMRLPILKRSLKRPNFGKYKKIIWYITLFCQDLFFSLIAAVGMVVITYTFNDGSIRIYPLVGTALGFLIYRFSVGILMERIGERLLFFLFAAISMLFYLFFFPISKIFRILCEKVKKMFEKIRKALAKRKKKVYNLYVKKLFFQKAEQGFLADIKPKEE